MEIDAGPADLPEGGMREIEAAGEKLLLVQTGGRCHAIGATCPHAGGPLVEGVLHDGAVLCPWHKAAFRVTDGRCVAPPAVDDVAYREVRQEGGRLLVSPGTRSSPVAIAPDRRCFAIIGAGAAGVAAAQALREEGFGGRIVMVGLEDRLPYDRTVLSKYALSGKKGGEKTPLHDASFYEAHRIERRTARVEAIEGGTIRFADGSSMTADQTLVATGGTPRPLKVPGAGLAGVFTLRTPDDARAIAEAADPGRHAVVVGAGFIGLEAAAALRERGLEVAVVAPQDVPLMDRLGPEVGAVFRRVHERKGIVFHMRDEVVEVTGEGRAAFVGLKSGRQLRADLVVVGLGVSPATGMLRGIGLRKDEGVTVDAGLQAGPGLFAAGDIAAFPWRGASIRVEHWRVAQQHGALAGLNMMGRGQTFDRVPVFWTIHFMKRLDYVGHADTWDSVELDGDLEEPEFNAYYVKDGIVAAVAGWGRDQLMAKAIGLMQDRPDWSVAELRAALKA